LTRPPTLLAAAALAGALACDGGSPAIPDAPDPAGPWFEEVALERGLAFRHESGHETEYYFPEIMGGGAALADLDGDGDLDAYLVQSGSVRLREALRPPNRLFRNLGAGRFEDATEGSGADDRGYGMGVATGDADGDGDVDLYVTNVGPNRLLANDGSARFADATTAAGVGDPLWSVSAAFFDAEADGDLDLFVTNYVLWSLADELDCDMPPLGRDYCSPRTYRAPAPDSLFLNEGAGRFRDASESAGLRTAFGNGLGLLAADFDADGRCDVFVANDATLNQLWINRGEGHFVDEALERGCATGDDGAPKAGMGVAAADLDADGDEDLLVVNLAGQTDSYFRNDGAFFSDRTSRFGSSRASLGYTRFGVGFADFDLDGRLDVFAANGRVVRATDPLVDDPYAEPNLLFRGREDGTLEERLPRGGTAELLVETSRGAAFGDVDGDGGVDVLVVNRDGPARLLRNVVAAGAGWIRLRAVDDRGLDILGARIELTVGARRVLGTVRSASSYASASDPALHVGLGAETGVRDVVVTWPDGTAERFGDLEGGRTVELRRGTGAR